MENLNVTKVFCFLSSPCENKFLCWMLASVVRENLCTSKMTKLQRGKCSE